MNIDDLFKVLTSASNTAEQDSPYAPISGFADQMGKAIDQQAASGGFRGRIGPALVSGLLSGIVGGTAKNLTDTYVEKQNDLARNVLADALSGRALTNAPDGMSPNVFSGLQNAGSLFQGGRALEQQDEARKFREQGQAEGVHALVSKVAATDPAAAMQLMKNAYGVDLGDVDVHPKQKYTPEFLASQGIDPNAPPDQVKFQLGQGVKNRLPPKTLDTLAQGARLADQVRNLAPLIDKMSGTNFGDSVIGAGERALASSSLDYPEGQYQNRLKQLSDQLARQFAGRAGWPAIQQQLSALTVRQIGSRDALKGVVNNLANILEGNVQEQASTYGQAGYNAVDAVTERLNKAAQAAAGTTTTTTSTSPPTSQGPGALQPETRVGPDGRTYIRVNGGWHAAP